MSRKEKILIFILVILTLVIISLIVFKIVFKGNNDVSNDELKKIIINEDYKFLGTSKKGEASIYIVDHYYSENKFVTCLVVHTDNYDVAKNNVKILQEDYISTGYFSEIEEKDNYTKLSTYGENGYFKISLAIDNYEFEIFTPKYQDKVEDIANKIIEYYSK